MRNELPIDSAEKKNSWIINNLLEVLVCSVAEYFYELCPYLTSSKGESKYKQRFFIIHEQEIRMLDPKESHYINVLTVEIKEKKRKTKKRETTYYIDNIPCLLL